MKNKIISYKWKLVIILWIAFFFNQADRQIFNVVLSEIRDDLGLTDAQMGVVSTSFLVVYGVMVPVAGIIGDWFSKKNVVMVALLVWTTATLLTGFSSTLISLILLRCVALGGGEAFYSPSANSLIGESHNKTLSTALSIHQTALYFGVILSSYLTGYIAEIFGWRMPFFLFGGAGLILAAVIYFHVKDSGVLVNEESRVINNREKDSVRVVLSVFFRKPTAILLAMAFAGMQFVGMGFMTWMPTYLSESFGLNLAKAGFDSTFYYKIAAFFAILIGARITDKLSVKFKGARGMIQAIGLLIGVPAVYFMGDSHEIIIVYISMFFYGIGQGLYDSNIFASLYEVVEFRYRATATGIMLSFAFIVGALAPLILGVIKPYIGLSSGISFLCIGLLFSAVCILLALKVYYPKDRIKEIV